MGWDVKTKDGENRKEGKKKIVVIEGLSRENLFVRRTSSILFLGSEVEKRGASTVHTRSTEIGLQKLD